MKHLSQPRAALALAAALVAASPGVRAANIVVTRLADTPLAGQCTLREALQAAQSNADSGGCVGSGAYGDDTITFETVAAGASGLQYDATSDTYTYVWKTSKAWSGRCATLLLRFDDGSERQALFRFK